ncbi:MAG TPA: ABC transporter permease [Puia sp.]|nr:ABC transporter permease [Puia sp.]
MFKNYLRVAIRQFWKNKRFSIINILGLSLGISCSLLILLWVLDERSMDAFHTKGDRLFRAYVRTFNNGKVGGGYYTPGPLAEEMKRQIPEIELSTAYLWPQPHTFSANDKILKEKCSGGDTAFFRMFSYPLLEGEAGSALSGPESIAISKTMSINFFGSAHDAIGKPIRFDSEKEFKVTAVFDDLPANTSEQFDCIMNWNAICDVYKWAKSWDDYDPFTYVLLREGTNVAQTEKKIADLLYRREEKHSPGMKTEVGIQRLSESYLHSNFSNGQPEGGRIEYLRIFILIAVFILLIACINFMNLTTARSLKRSREVGVRKVMGAIRSSVMLQFVCEAVFIACLAALLALVVVALVLPSFNTLTGKQIALPYSSWRFWMMFSALCLGTGLLSGIYPSLLLSSFNPARVLKASVGKINGGAISFRKGLVVFQFTLSIVLIISTIFISRQVRFVQQADLGYDKDNLIYIPMEGELAKNFDVFKSQALKFPGVAAVSAVNLSPTNLMNGTMGVDWPGKAPNYKPTVAQLAVSYDFIDAMKLQLAAGRDFSRSFATDSSNYIINEAAATMIGYKDPVGKSLTFWGTTGNIIGVVHDFHFQSFHQAVRPLVIRLLRPSPGGTVMVRIQPRQTLATAAFLEQLSKKLNPQFPFTFQFTSEEYEKLYRNDELVGNLSVIFSSLAIVISCMGLLGLTMFIAEQRRKEIGVRKVLGAGVVSLIRLLSFDILLLIGIAFAVAIPVSIWALHQWLESFAYHTELSWWVFAAAGMSALLISLGTVGFHTIRAALTNPISALKTE